MILVLNEHSRALFNDYEIGYIKARNGQEFEKIMSYKPNITTICPYCRDSRILKVNGTPIYKCRYCKKLFLSPLRDKPVKHNKKFTHCSEIILQRPSYRTKGARGRIKYSRVRAESSVLTI